MTDIFNGRNTSGGTNDFSGFPGSVTQGAWFVTPTDPGAITFTGFTAGAFYDFTFVSSRVTEDNRIGEVTLTGGNVKSVNVDARTPTLSEVGASNISSISSIQADEVGTIILDLVFVSSTGSNFSYLNGIQITSVPEPSSFAAIVGCLASVIVLARRRRR